MEQAQEVTNDSEILDSQGGASGGQQRGTHHHKGGPLRLGDLEGGGGVNRGGRTTTKEGPSGW
eukprot:1187625-Prorocentrum_minimum.AAC.2